MKKRILSIALTLAILGVLLLSSTAYAVTTPFWSGTTTATISDPISVVVTGGNGSIDGSNAWTVTIYGAGTAHLNLRATNNSNATDYTITGAITGTPPAGCTAVWTIPSGGVILKNGGTLDIILTVTSGTSTPLPSTYSFGMVLNHN